MRATDAPPAPAFDRAAERDYERLSELLDQLEAKLDAIDPPWAAEAIDAFSRLDPDDRDAVLALAQQMNTHR